MAKYTYALRLQGASNYIDLNRKIANVRSLRILNVRYTTSAANNVFCILSINGFNNKDIIYGTSTTKYTKLLMLPDATTSIMTHSNITKEEDVIFEENQAYFITNIQLDILFGKTDGTLTYPNSEITSTNPFIVEFEIIGD